MAQAKLPERIYLTNTQKEVLYGALLGDGSLIKPKKGVNAQFCYLSKSRAHVEYVSKFFQEYWSGEGIKDSSYIDNRTNKEYFRSALRTYTNFCFTEEYYKWYINRKKHLPDDLKLTPLICLIWYLGDGGISHSERSECIKLSTQGFLREEQEKILLPQLKKFEATLAKADIGKDNIRQYYIYIPHRKEKDFLNYIGECPFEDYKYKWDIAEYINSIPQNHTDKEQEFCEKYKNGMTYYAIAKEYKIEPNVVKHYLIKNNLYIPPNKKTKNAIIHLSKNNEYLNIYCSGVDAGKALNLSSSMISSVKNGHKKMKDGSYFKSYKDFNSEEQKILQKKFKEYFN